MPRLMTTTAAAALAGALAGTGAAAEARCGTT